MHAPVSWTRALTAALCVGICLASPATVAIPSGPSVTIADGALTPPVVSVIAGGNVLWTNAGTRPHEIVAQNNAFPTFSVTPGGTHGVSFQQPGRYPYVLDGAIKGTVFVVRPGGGGVEGTSEKSSASSPSSCVTIYRYDVRVVAHRESTATGGAGGALKTMSDWKASAVVRLYVDRCSLPFQITARSSATSANRGSPLYLTDGQFDKTVDWDDARTENHDPPCHFAWASSGPSRMAVTVRFGGLSKTVQNTFDLLDGEDLVDQAPNMADFTRRSDAWRAACVHNRPGYTSYNTTIPNSDLPEIPGLVSFVISDHFFHLVFKMPPNSPAEASMVDSLVAGKGFNYDTGMKFVQESAGTSRVRGTVSFSRLQD